MKKLIIIFTTICISHFATAQVIAKGTKTLTVVTEKSQSENFGHTITQLLQEGYELERSDRELGTISTAWRPLPRSGSYKLYIRVSDEIKFSGVFKSGTSIDVYGVRSEDTPQEIEKRGSPKSVYGMAFNAMYKTAEKTGKIKF